MAAKKARYERQMKFFGMAVKYIRTQRELSQEALADIANLDRSYMSQIERGIKNATLGSIWRIANALGVRPSEIISMSESLASRADAQPSRSGAQTATGEKSVPASGEQLDILVVDDDPDVCAAIKALLDSAGFAVETASNGFEAFKLIVTRPIKLVVSDVKMSNGNGFELLDAVKKHNPDLPVVFITGYNDVTEEAARQRGASGLFAKPFSLADFITGIREILPEQPVN